MKKILIPAALIAAAILSGAAKKNDPTLMTVNGKPVKVSEFTYLYNKNNQQQAEPQTLDEYVDMFVNYRLKVADAEAAGPALSSGPGDSRITSVGRFIRKYRLDELPNFWNVVRGDMSIVGPRPEREYFVSRLIEREPYYALLHSVRPGITSWGMVKFGYATNVDEMIERMKYDLLYLENMSIGIDIKILFYTVRTVVTGRGI